MKLEVAIGMVRVYKARQVPIPLHIAAVLIDNGIDIDSIKPARK